MLICLRNGWIYFDEIAAIKTLVSWNLPDNYRDTHTDLNFQKHFMISIYSIAIAAHPIQVDS